MTRTQLLHHFGHLIEAPNGIQKLRELILQLAVQGKLVPQNPNDEPASELLKRIQAEKARLVAEGKIKKPKPLPEITEAEKPFELPEGWEWVRFGQIGTIGSSSRVHQKDWKTKGVPFYRAREIVLLSKHGQVNNELFISEDHFSTLSESGYIPEQDDIMITGVGTIGTAYVVKSEDRFYFKDASVLIFKNHFNINPSFLLLISKSPYWQSMIHAESMGTTVHTLTIVRANESLVTLPPLAEQHRIVAKVDELMALCDQLEAERTARDTTHQQLIRAVHHPLTEVTDSTETQSAWHRIRDHFNHLYTTPESVQALRQTILQLAVQGKLVPQDPNDEPASELLKRIQAEKAKLVAEGKIKKPKPLPPISEDEKPFELPEGWEWVRIGDMMPDFQNGASSRGDKEGHEITVLRLADIKDWKVSLAATRKLRMSFASISKYSLMKNDILLIRVNGSADIVGRFILCTDDYDAIYCDHFIRLRLPINVVAAIFLELLGSSTLIRERIKGLFITTAGQKTVNQKHISSLVFALPPITEQRRIVAKVDELMALCGQLESQIKAKSDTAARYAEAIVQELAA